MHLPDLLLVIFVAAVWPFLEYFGWLQFLDRSRVDQHRARRWLWGTTLATQWLVAGAAIFAWMSAGRTLSVIGLVAPEGWRLVLAVVLIGGFTFLYGNTFLRIARNPALRPRVRKKLGTMEAVFAHTTDELGLSLAVAITAGICEELIFRGFWIGMLSPIMGWWGAAALGVPVFAVAHAYQGRMGMVRVAITATMMTLVVALTRSLLPAMAIHVVVDVFSGLVTWMAVRQPVTAD